MSLDSRGQSTAEDSRQTIDHLTTNDHLVLRTYQQRQTITWCCEPINTMSASVGNQKSEAKISSGFGLCHDGF
jgi:hypothetical protein